MSKIFPGGMPPDPPRLFGPPLSVSGPPLSKKPGSALELPQPFIDMKDAFLCQMFTQTSMSITTTFKNIIHCATLLTQRVGHHAFWPCCVKVCRNLKHPFDRKFHSLMGYTEFGIFEDIQTESQVTLSLSYTEYRA